METKDILMGIVLLVALVGGWGWHRNRVVQAGRNWKPLAERLGGRFESDGAGWIKNPRHRLVCTISGVELTLDAYVTTTGDKSTSWTRARVVCDPDLRFNIHREDVFQKLGKGLGLRDVEVGDGEYDRTFAVKAEDAERLRAACTREFMDAHLARPDVSVSAKDGSLRVVRHGIAVDAESATDLLEFAAVVGKTFNPS